MQSVATLVQQLAERARDPNFGGTSMDAMISLLSFSQQVVNGVVSDVVDDVPLVLTPGQTVYQLSAVLPACVKVLAVRDATGRDMEPLDDFNALAWVNTQWLTATTSVPRSYALAGRDLLIIYPAPSGAYTVTVVFAELTTTLTSQADITEVQNETDDALMDLSEVLLLLKARDLVDCKAILDRFVSRMKGLTTESR